MAQSQKQQSSATKPRHRWMRFFLRSLLAIAIIGIICSLWSMMAHFPAPIERYISKKFSSESIKLCASDISFSIVKMRLSVGSLTLKADGVDHTTALSIDDAEISLRPHSLFPSLSWVHDVRIDSAMLNAKAISSLQGSSDDNGNGNLSFEPIHFSIRSVAGAGLELRNLSGNLSAIDNTLCIDDATISFQGPGEPAQSLKGRISVALTEQAVEAICSGHLDFSKLVPVLNEFDCASIATELAKFEFPSRPPQVDLRFYRAPARQKRSLGFSIESGMMRYNGVRLSEFFGDIRVSGEESWNLIEIDPIVMRRAEGSALGNIAINIGENALSFDCSSSLNPLHLAAMIGLSDSQGLPDIEFVWPVDVHCSGSLGLGEGNEAKTSLKVSASAAGATFKNYELSQIAISGSIVGNTIDFPHISAEMEEGNIEMSLSYEGAFSALGANVPTSGHGSISADIHEAKLFRVPLFAGLTDILSRYIPGVDFVVDQNEAQVQATLNEGRWNLTKLSVSGGGFTFDGTGTATANGSEIDIYARVRLMNKRTWLGRIVQRLLSPLSGLLGVRASGSLDSPHWSLAPFQGKW